MGAVHPPLPAPVVGRPRLLRRLLRALAMRRSLHRLAELEDHLLRDLGLTPEQARREAERPCWDAPSHWLH